MTLIKKFNNRSLISSLSIAIVVTALTAGTAGAWGGSGDDIDGICVGGACGAAYCGTTDLDVSNVVGGTTTNLGTNVNNVLMLTPSASVTVGSVRLSLTQGGLVPYWGGQTGDDIDCVGGSGFHFRQ